MKIKNLFLLAALGLMASATLTSCEDVLGHWEKPTPTPITPTVEEAIMYGFKVTDLAGVDRTEAVTSLKMSNDDATVATAEVSGGKITIKADDLKEITTAMDFWFEAEIGGQPYVAKVTIDPTALSPETDKTLEMATLGDVILSDGKFAAPSSTGTKVAVIAYLGNGSECNHGLAIQLNDTPTGMSWSDACNYSSYPSITNSPGTWRLPSKADWQNMFVGCAKDGDDSDASDNELNPIAGFKEKIGATGITWQTFSYWSSTDSGSDAWTVGVDLDGGSASADFGEIDTSSPCNVLGCLAF